MYRKQAKSVRIEQIKLVQTIGQRMREARELCNLSQTVAAKKLGYANSSKLAKIEGATDTYSVPLYIIQRAAALYEVSIDFLFGVSDDWEYSATKAQDRKVSPWLWIFFQNAFTREMSVLMHLNARLTKISQAIQSMGSHTLAMSDTVHQFRAANPWFDDEAKLGAKFMRHLEQLEGAMSESKAELKRFERECEQAKKLNSFADERINTLPMVIEQAANG